MLRIEALADTLLAGALAGNASAAKLVLELAHKFVPPDQAVEGMQQASRGDEGHPRPSAWPAFTQEELRRMETLKEDMDREYEAMQKAKAENGEPTT